MAVAINRNVTPTDAKDESLIANSVSDCEVDCRGDVMLVDIQWLISAPDYAGFILQTSTS